MYVKKIVQVNNGKYPKTQQKATYTVHVDLSYMYNVQAMLNKVIIPVLHM